MSFGYVGGCKVHLLKTQRCKYGDECQRYDPQTGVSTNCWFAHGEREVRCPEFARLGSCHHGESCGFKHTPAIIPQSIKLHVGSPKIITQSSGDRPGGRTVVYVRDLVHLVPPNELVNQICECKTDAVKNRMPLGQIYLQDRYNMPLSIVAPNPDKLSLADIYKNDELLRQYLLHCLWIETCQSRSDIRRYDILEGEISAAEYSAGKYLFRINCDGLAEKRPSVLRGDKLFIRDNRVNRYGNHDMHLGYVHFVNLDHVMVSFDRNAFRPSRQATYHVIFHLNETTADRQCTAIKHAQTSLSFDDDMFSSTSIADRHNILERSRQAGHVEIAASMLNNIGCRLNEEQLDAATRILTACPVRDSLGCFLLHGPPGTGKTTTLCSAVLAIVSKDPSVRILIATPSNMSADLIVERLIRRNKSLSLLRVCAQSYDIDKACSAEVQPFCDSYKKRDLTLELVNDHQIIVTTMMSCGLLYGIGVSGDHFHHIVVDEAGQATEAEMLVPMLFASKAVGTHITLAGDHKQLGAVLRSKAVESLNFGVSTLERLISVPEIHDNLSVQLTDSYRAHPEILSLYNTLTYNGSLRACGAQRSTRALESYFKRHHPDRATTTPMRFFHVDGEETRERDSPSWLNIDEVRVLMTQLVHVVEVGCVDPADIVILSPYQKQLTKIKHTLHQKFLPGGEFAKYCHGYTGKGSSVLPITVCSVEAFQGREAKVIIMSCVRSKKLEELNNDMKQSIGFLKQPKRLNVAISRPIAGLIIIGNVGLLQQDKYWCNLIALMGELNVVMRPGDPYTDPVPMSRRDLDRIKDLYDYQQRLAASAAVPSNNPIDGEWNRLQ